MFVAGRIVVGVTEAVAPPQLEPTCLPSKGGGDNNATTTIMNFVRVNLINNHMHAAAAATHGYKKKF